jgi:hypothetical protein
LKCPKCILKGVRGQGHHRLRPAPASLGVNTCGADVKRRSIARPTLANGRIQCDAAAYIRLHRNLRCRQPSDDLALPRPLHLPLPLVISQVLTTRSPGGLLCETDLPPRPPDSAFIPSRSARTPQLIGIVNFALASGRPVQAF